jgi:MoxR-like ATPase
MEERQVTIDGVSRPVGDPFFAIATQNPIEYQGTFPLPEARMDRFTLSLTLGYPTEAEELQMLERLSNGMEASELKPCITLEEVLELRRLVKQVKVDKSLQQYIVNLVRATREHSEITLGVSPRGAVALHRATQAYAFLEGRDFAIPDDVKALAPFVLSHRLIAAGGRRANTIISEWLLPSIPIPEL